MEQIEVVAKDIETRIKKQEDNLNYVKFKLSRSTDTLSLMYNQDNQVSQKYSKYVSDKVVVTTHKPHISSQRQEFINQLIHSSDSSRFTSEYAYSGLAP